MAKSFMQMAKEAMAQVEGISAQEAQQRLKQDPNALFVDVRDAAEIPTTGLATGGLNISLGMLPVRAEARCQTSRSLAPDYHLLPARSKWRHRSKTS